jgi:Sensors of blue-light using FAD
MGLSQLVYRSAAADDVVGIERMMALRHIHARAMDINRRNGVTGFLAFTMKHFVQVLEGERPVVTSTFDKIARDRRHKDIELLGITHCQTRIFGRWSMGAIFDEDIIREAMRCIGATGELNVMRLNAPQIIDVLNVMAKRHGSEDARQVA